MVAFLARGPGVWEVTVRDVQDVSQDAYRPRRRARYHHVMTTEVQTRSHPLVDKHKAVLDDAIVALATRHYYSRYPESPSPKVYGESAAAQGLTAYQEHLGKPYAGLASQPTDGTEVGSEVSPYGPVLGVRYPRLDLDAAFSAAKAALPAWRDAGARVRASVCVEILERINARSFEMANAVMHTSGQPFVMSFQAGGPQAQDRALEAVVAGLVEQERVPESVVWEKPGRDAPLRMQKDYRIIPRGVALVIGCNTFPNWNSYPGLFASPRHEQRGHRQAAPAGRTAVGHHRRDRPGGPAGERL